MKKTLVYIDGYNLYYGLLKGLPASKWLDLRTLVASMFKEEHEIVSIKYFTARVRTYPYDIAAEERQKIYLQALAASGGVEIVEGFYSKKKAWLPHVNGKCKVCKESHAGMAHVGGERLHLGDDLLRVHRRLALRGGFPLGFRRACPHPIPLGVLPTVSLWHSHNYF